LVVYSVAVQGAIGPCQKAKLDAGERLPGKFIPQCTKYGFFEPAQCHGSTGKCWCVNPDTGVEVAGSATMRKEPECTMCYIKRADALRPTGLLLGQYAPVCNEDGLFDATQRHGSTGQSWCVNRYTGEEIPNTRLGPGQQRPTPCSAVATTVGLNMHSLLEEQGPCYAKILAARGGSSTPGFYTPGCTAQGFFKTEQHHSSTGYTWCVNPTTGIEIQGTRRSPVQARASCGACFKEIEEKLTRKPMLGSDVTVSQCNDENGDYLPIQQHEGYSWCVNAKTGAVEGKKNLPGDNSPLPCVNA
jgi:hypothetical protein